ncbi:hypothetical protein G4B88_002488 [Cannabis sativa]|uniref:RNase H type-1 domain-containing protein n=1 Tax=Cannabis sativa TaxID=3483 RepID=A0A7J6I8Y0_CANSA|nr:hypothetical protein G4B88_002488 [Cannabis sativa]
MEDWDGTGVGKLQKIANPPKDISGTLNLFEVPIIYSKEAKEWKEGHLLSLVLARRQFQRSKGDWDKEAIHTYFKQEDIPWILGTPVDTHMEDTLIWPFTTNGEYVVKSGYRVAREINLCPIHWTGTTLSAGRLFLPSICPAVIAEAEAVIAAMKASPIGAHQRFEIRSDYKVLVESFKDTGSPLSDVSLVINKIKRYQFFPHCTKLTFVKRKNNEIAHSLAKKSLESKITEVFSHSLPKWLANICKTDLSNSL